jgi:hypothetical protein
MYVLILQELLHVTTYTLPWAIQCNSHDAISNTGGFLESDVVVLTNTLQNQELSDYVGPDVKVVVSPVSSAVAPAT